MDRRTLLEGDKKTPDNNSQDQSILKLMIHTK